MPSLNLSWSCPTCKYTLPTLLRLDDSISEIRKSNDERLSKLETEVEGIDHKIETKTIEKMKQTKEELIEELSRDLTNKMDIRIKEQDDRKTRNHNLMIYNLSESISENPEIRKDTDIKLMTEISSSLGLDISIKTGFRIGNRGRNKTRPYKIILDNKKDRRNLLVEAKNIRAKAPPHLKQVIIAADYTPQQREERKELMQELNTARLTNKDAKIRDGKIIYGDKSREETKYHEKAANVKRITEQTSRKTLADQIPINKTIDTNLLSETVANYMDITLLNTDATVIGGITSENFTEEPTSPDVKRA